MKTSEDMLWRLQIEDDRGNLTIYTNNSRDELLKLLNSFELKTGTKVEIYQADKNKKLI